MFGFSKKSQRSVLNENVEVSEVSGIRSLFIGSNTIQSSMRVNAPYELQLKYSRAMMLFLLFAPKTKDALVLGLGGGSLPKFINCYLPHMYCRVVELSPQVIRIAHSHFYLPQNGDQLEVIEGDAVQYVYDHPETTELLMLDLFDANGVPPDMYSQDFFDACAATLKDSGMFTVNLWGSDKNFDIYLRRIEQSFVGRVLKVPTGRPGNIVVMGFNRVPTELRWEQLRQKAKELDAQYKLDFMDLLDRLRDHNPNSKHKILME